MVNRDHFLPSNSTIPTCVQFSIWWQEIKRFPMSTSRYSLSLKHHGLKLLCCRVEDFLSDCKGRAPPNLMQMVSRAENIPSSPPRPQFPIYLLEFRCASLPPPSRMISLKVLHSLSFPANSSRPLLCSLPCSCGMSLCCGRSSDRA